MTDRRRDTCLPTTPIREVARVMAQADRVAVTDPKGRLLGAVTGAALRVASRRAKSRPMRPAPPV